MLDRLKQSSPQAIIHLFSNSVIQVFVAFVTNIILVRSISPQTFGSFAILIAIIGFVFSILSLRLSIHIINTPKSEYNESFVSKMNSVFFLEILSIFLCSLGVLFFTDNFQFWAIVILLALSTQHFVDYMKCFFERNMNYRVLARVETYSRLIGHFFAVISIYFFPNKGFEILILREFISALCMLFGLWFINGLIPFVLSLPNRKVLSEFMAKIKSIWFEGVLEQSFTRLTILSVSYISNSAGVGIFSQAQRLSNLLDQFIAPIYSRFSLNWYSRQENSNKRMTAMYLLTFSLLIINSLLVIFLYYFIEAIVLFLYGDVWIEVANAMFYLFGLIIFRSPFEALKAYCYSQNILKIIFLARMIQFFILALATFGSFEFFGDGIKPVTIALSLSYGLGFVLIILLIPIIEFKNKKV